MPTTPLRGQLQPLVTMRLSQSHLTLLELCPRKFQYTYLEQIVAPLSPDDQLRREWGTQFHLMMQQRELGMPPLAPILSSVAESPQPPDHFSASVEALLAELPTVFDSDQAPYRLSEHRRVLDCSSEGDTRDEQMNQRPFLLSAVYDLIFVEDQRATIFDWKTYRKPKHPQWLAEHWQTRLYPFILAETSDLEPSQISMVYWFVSAHEGEAIAPQSIPFPYDQAQHDATGQRIDALLHELSTHLSAYERGIPMPKVDEEKGLCGDCPFALRCGRSPQNSSAYWLDISALLNIDPIAEVPL